MPLGLCKAKNVVCDPKTGMKMGKIPFALHQFLWVLTSGDINMTQIHFRTKGNDATLNMKQTIILILFMTNTDGKKKR